MDDRSYTRRDAWTQDEDRRVAIFLERPLTRAASRIFFPQRSFEAVRTRVCAARKAAGVLRLPPAQLTPKVTRASFWHGIIRGKHHGKTHAG